MLLTSDTPRRLGAAMACITLAAPVALAQPEPPPQPGSDAFDWMQLTNGEWLKGEIIKLRDGDFTFDSDELDERDFDFEDIARFLSKEQNTLLFRDGTVVEGAVSIEGDLVSVTSPDGKVKTFPRSELQG